MEDQLLTFVILVYGAAVSWIEERFGTFQDLDARTKQLVNAVFGFVVPALVVWVVPGVKALLGGWPVELGTPEAFTTSVLYLLVPVLIWLVTQAAHYIDLVFDRAAKSHRK